MKIHFLIPLLFFVLGVAEAQAPLDTLTIEGYIANNKIKAEKTKEGLFVALDKLGVGAKPRPGDYVKVKYVGKLLDGKVFDASPEGEPYVFQLGYRQAILAWDMGMRYITAGSKATLFVPAQLGYGGTAVGSVPANSPLMFEMEFLEIMSPADYDHYMQGVEAKDRKKAETKKAEQLETDKKLIVEYADKHKLKIQTTASGLSYVLTKSSKKPLLKPGQEASVEYEGRFLDDKVFDTSVGKDPFSFEIGTGKVIAGWDEGVQYFSKGSEGYLLIPSKLAYGTNPLDDGKTVVPANSVLIFKIRVKE